MNILDAWSVPPADRPALLGCDRSTYDRWSATRELGEYSSENLERISYILGIWKALQILYTDSSVANSWIHRVNADSTFQGRTPLQVMLERKLVGLADVRQYLDGWLG